MATQFNGSSYYRANPFYQQGYLPDSALKNRKSPSFMVELPQGNQFFQPTNKKHFQRVGYFSTIAEEAVISNDPTNSPARDKQYFRSLNVEDIEGASTNTLISKAVKNRTRAKQQLAMRHREEAEQQERQKRAYFQRMQDENKRMEALAKMKPQNQPNYHEKVMKMKTEESDQFASPKAQIKEQTEAEQFHNKKYSDYNSELQKTENQIKQLEQQLRLKNYQESNQLRKDYASMPSNQNRNQYYPQNEIKNIQLNQQKNGQKSYHQPYQNKAHSPIDQYRQPEARHSYRQYNHNQLQPQIESNQIEAKISPVPNRQYSGNLQPMNKVRSYTTQEPGSGDSPMFQEEGREAMLSRGQQFVEQQRFRLAKQTRQQHRRINPTYLSYGSASIGLAGRNIVGY